MSAVEAANFERSKNKKGEKSAAERPLFCAHYLIIILVLQKILFKIK